MQTQERQTYIAPSLKELGDLNEVTRAGSASNSDALPFVDNTGFGPQAGLTS